MAHDGESLALAERALALVDADPEQARTIAGSVLELTPEPISRAVAERTVGRLLARQGDLRGALKALQRSVQQARRAGAPIRVAQAQSSAVPVLLGLGRFAEALTLADAAGRVLDGPDLGRLLGQRAIVLSRLDRTTEALDAYDRALRLLPDEDSAERARVLSNRALLRTYRGQLTSARQDLDEALGLCVRDHLRSLEASVTHNQGYLAFRSGDLVAALQLLDRAAVLRAGMGQDTYEVILDRAETLLVAELREEAIEAARQARNLARAAHRSGDLPEAELTLARAQLMSAEFDSARASALRARRAFRQQRRDGWAAIADALTIRSRWSAGERGRRIEADARRCIADLEAHGWTAAATQIRVLAAEAMLHSGRRAEAAAELRSTRRSGSAPADVRVAAWHVEALLRAAAGDRSGALRALRAGLDVVAKHSAALGATDLRTQSMARGRALADLGLDLVLARGRPRDVLVWLERIRTTALHRRPVQPPRDSDLAEALAELRAVTSAIGDARAAGTDSADLRRTQLRLERHVRDLSRHARGDTSGSPSERLDITALAASLRDRGLVEYFWHGDRVHAVLLIDGQCSVVELGDYASALREAESLRFAMNRLARRHGTSESLSVALATRDHAAAALDDLLVGPLRQRLGDRELVVIPTMSLHALPWPALPSLANRPVSIAPSAAIWLAAARSARPDGATALVAGPDLVFADEELDRLAGVYPKAARLSGPRATAQATLAALDGARLAHVACHGHFRSDNPQFSSLRMADGPLMVYDLERMDRAPDVVVLSACETALSAVHPGDELVGLSSAFFALGTRTLVASVSPVDDEAAKILMVDFHTRLAAGEPPARALAAAQANVGVIGFACYGAG